MSDCSRTEKITLECRGPVHDSLNDECIARVNFVATQAGGFAVHFYGRMDPIVDKEVLRSDEELSWRSAARALLMLDECEVNPEGCSTSVAGVDGFVRVILTRCWARLISREAVSAAFACGDEQLCELWNWTLEPQTRIEACLDGCETNQGVDEAQEDDEEEDDADADCAVEDDEGARTPPVVVYLRALHDLGAAISCAGLDGLSVSGIAKELGCSPDERAPWPQLTKRIRGHAANSGIRQYIDKNAGSEQLSSSVLQGLLQYPSPEDSAIVTRLLHSWAIAKEKPLAVERETGSDVANSPWPFLMWLLAENVERNLFGFRSEHPKESADICLWLAGERDVAVKHAAIRGPRGFGDRYWSGASSAAQRHLRLCEAVLAILN